MTNLSRAIIIEIDGCLADNSHRLHFVDPYKNSDYIFIDDVPSYWEKKNSNEKFKPDYQAFYNAMGDDKVNEWCSQLLSGWISNGYGKVIFLTGRPEKYRVFTKDWLLHISCIRHMGHSDDLDLFMRPDYLGHASGIEFHPDDHYARDNRPAHEVKREIFEREIKDKYEILFAIDSDERSVEMYRSIGLVCLDVGRK